MGKEQIMEDVVRDLTELALQEHRETTGEAEQNETRIQYKLFEYE